MLTLLPSRSPPPSPPSPCRRLKPLLFPVLHRSALTQLGPSLRPKPVVAKLVVAATRGPGGGEVVGKKKKRRRPIVIHRHVILLHNLSLLALSLSLPPSYCQLNYLLVKVSGETGGRTRRRERKRGEGGAEERGRERERVVERMVKRGRGWPL